MYHVHVYNVQPGDCPVQHRMATVCHQEPTACDKMVQSMYTVVFFLAAGHSVKALQKLLWCTATRLHSQAAMLLRS